MENLLQKLKPDLKSKIESDLDIYPALVGALLEELKNKSFLNDVKYMYIIDLQNFYRLTYGDFWITPWDCLINQN
jgi:hypothetical protein